jgi:hypothetical protein
VVDGAVDKLQFWCIVDLTSGDDSWSVVQGSSRCTSTSQQDKGPVEPGVVLEETFCHRTWQ